MSLSDLASLGSFISGLAVLVSLIFLYFQLRQVNQQVRQAEINQRAFMNQGVATRVIEILKFAGEKENVAPFARATSGETEFSAEELMFLSLFLRMTLMNMQDTRVQHAQGLATQIVLDYGTGVVRGLLGFPAFRALWPRLRPTLAPDTASFVDTFIAEVPLAQPIDRLAQYRSALSEIMHPNMSAVT
jgi:hypothetical protein